MTRFNRVILSAILAMSPTLAPSQTSLQGTSDVHPENSSDNVVHVAGFQNIKPNEKGTLTLNKETILFVSSGARASIQRDRITNVFVGDQRTETGGKVGSIARKVIPFGGGQALAVASNKKVDLLSIEYRDEQNGSHGVVLVLPARKAEALRSEISTSLLTSSPEAAPPCREGKPGTVLLTPITSSGIEIPAEYRILLYEQTIRELKANNLKNTVLRDGEPSTGPACTNFTLEVTVKSFKKGNRAVRASTGPLGFFIGTTSLTFEADLRDSTGRTVSHIQLKKSLRSDSDSLGLADDVAKAIAKRLRKSLEKSTTQFSQSEVRGEVKGSWVG